MLHKNITTGDQHFLHNWTVSSSSNLAGIAVVASDAGKVALVTANSSFYILQDSTPTWQALGGAGGGGGAALSAGTQSVSTGTVNFANSNGISFGMSNSNQITASHNGLTSQSNQAASASNGSFTFQTLGFSNANGVTFGTSAGSIVTASVNAAGGATLSSYEPCQVCPTTSFSNLGVNSLYFTPFIIPNNVAVSRINFAFSENFGSTNQTTYGATQSVSFGIYGRDVGASTSQITLITSGSLSHYISFSSNVSFAYVHAIAGSTTSSTSAGLGLFSSLGGNPIVYFPLTTTLVPGEYWMANLQSSQSTNGAIATFIPLIIGSQFSGANFQYPGFTGTVTSGGMFGQGLGIYTATTNALPSSVTLNQVSIRSNLRVYFNFQNYLT